MPIEFSQSKCGNAKREQKNDFNFVWRVQSISGEWVFTIHREAVLRLWCLDIQHPNIYHLNAIHRHTLVDLWKNKKRKRKICGMHFHDIFAFTHQYNALVWSGCSLRANVSPMAVAELHYPTKRHSSYENTYFVLKYQQHEYQSWPG